MGNLTKIDYPSSTDVTFTYDSLNRASNMVDAVGTTIYSYTAGNQLFTEDGPFTSDVTLPTFDFEATFFKCLAECMKRKGFGGGVPQ